MSEPTATTLRETILRQCLAADPNPWYPKEYAEATASDRERLYGPLNDLRLAQLVQLTEWVQGKGQGYLITPLGKEVLNDPTSLARLRDGKGLAPAAAPAESTRPTTGTSRFERGEAARRAFYSPGAPRIVPTLILINILAFLISIAVAAASNATPRDFVHHGDLPTLRKVGVLDAPDLANGEWWRLLTNCFLHFGLLHITLNMTALILLRRGEALWGPGRFLVLYLIAGVCGSCVAIFFNPGSPSAPTYLAGASGSLWGVMIGEAVWVLINRSHLPTHDVRRWFQQFFFVLVLNVGVSLMPGVSAAAHLGGGVAGAIAALLLQVHQHGSQSRKTVAGVQLALLPMVFLLGLWMAMQKDHRLQPFMAQVYQEQVTSRLEKLPPAFGLLEGPAEALHLQQSSKRDMIELKRVRDGLGGLVKQANEAKEWLEKGAPVESAKPLKDKALRLLTTLVAYAEALDKQAGGVEVDNVNDLRKDWQEAKLAWTLTTGK